jgi:hypothetical protein
MVYIRTDCCALLRKGAHYISKVTDCIASALIVLCNFLQVCAVQIAMKICTSIPMMKKGMMMMILVMKRTILTMHCHL